MVLDIPAPSLVVLCGPVGSGKTTFAAARFPPTEIVSTDTLRALVGEDESDVRASRDAFDLLYEVCRRRLRRRLTTVVDSTALNPRVRSRLRRIAREARVPCLLLAFDVPLEECVRRNAARGRQVCDDVIVSQSEAFRRVRDKLALEGYSEVRIVDAAGEIAGRDAGPGTRLRRAP